ncbi:TetR/AcrR family transcriptional regulator [Paenibacillus sp. GSMTC-2017]|uniref:TetR/AcrR family transcriptional regulator n=1 Tax=Paenibacillus sp. GSMTC-2017 TaxID=2794350 RepID=UPI0018D9B321|nr:TetR/AcrR family transcriptional regulator [Paenibacillus sp. GSMTC-2017]MBH5317545.1 TetR/AcrR family transcriptional regulator [Paenibacillus sp. GSMTC-2017]
MSTQSAQLQEMFLKGFEEDVQDKAVRQIILHAIEVFSKKGFTGTKIKDIAQSAGFSQGYVYTYFKSKDELFTKIVELATLGSGRSVYQASQLIGSPIQKITWLTEAFMSADSIAMQHWRLILLQTTTSESIPEEAKRVAKENAIEPFKHFIPLVIQGQQDGEIVEGDPFMLAITYFSFIQGLGISKIQTTSELPFPSAEVVLRFLRK